METTAANHSHSLVEVSVDHAAGAMKQQELMGFLQ